VYEADEETDNMVELFATFDWQAVYLPLVMR
jgi:hypothetical protein